MAASKTCNSAYSEFFGKNMLYKSQATIQPQTLYSCALKLVKVCQVYLFTAPSCNTHKAY